MDSEKDFRNVNLGCTAQEVISSEKFELSQGDPNKDSTLLIYKDVEIDGNKVNISYNITNGTFQNGIIIYSPDDSQAFFDGLKERMVQRHGDDYISFFTTYLKWNTGEKCYELYLMENGRIAYSVMTKEYSDMLDNHK